MQKTTFVLGAGSSHFLGLPMGSGLRSQILQLASASEREFAIRAGLFQDPNELYGFVSAFRQSQMYSIDAFLARRPNYSSIGKKAIAAIILRAEAGSALDQVEHDDHWYRYLLNALCNSSIDNIETGAISIVSFNYDRSLEAYLYQSIQAIFAVDPAVAASTLDEFSIVHVYGCLGSPVPTAESYLAYGGEVTGHAVNSASNRIIVIPEGRDDSETLVKARRLLEGADQIVFLGFGFDEQNLARLNSETTCASAQQRKDGIYVRSLLATCYGMTVAEARTAHGRLGQGRQGWPPAGDLPTGFWKTGCLQLLRETQILAK